MVKIALAQINSSVGDIKGNYATIEDYLRRARRKKADIVVFPELALSGYPPEDLLLKPNFVEANGAYLRKLKAHTKGIVAIVGFVDKKDRHIYNAYALIEDGEIKDIYHKIYLPNYGVFDEKRYFTPGESITCYQYRGHLFSVNICEDIWDTTYVSQLTSQRLDFVINLSASPFHLGKFFLRRKVLAKASKRLRALLLYCNLVGGQDELVFDGTSMIFSPQGQLITYAKHFEEDLLLFSFDKKKKYSPQKIKIREEEEIFGALRLGLYDYVKKNRFKKVIVGVSGGIDSAVVVSLATYVLGKNNVKALIMPSSYTSPSTLKDAQKICNNLGIQYSLISIDSIFKNFCNSLVPFFKGSTIDKTEENIQARVRGNLLMAFSNKFGYLVLNTGNKSETACGYCTLYGDMVGGFGVLKDVPKTMVYRLARYINTRFKKKVIPTSVFKRSPSAELKPNQRDSDTLPDYPLLDEILSLYVEEDLSLDEIVALGFNRSLTKKIIAMVDANEYKRRQAPVGIKITPRAFGKDRRMPITNRFLL